MKTKTHTVQLPTGALSDIISAHALPEFEFDITVGLWNKIEAALQCADGPTLALAYDIEEMIELRNAFEAVGRRREHRDMLDAILEAMGVES